MNFAARAGRNMGRRGLSWKYTCTTTLLVGDSDYCRDGAGEGAESVRESAWHTQAEEEESGPHRTGRTGLSRGQTEERGEEHTGRTTDQRGTEKGEQESCGEVL